MAFCQKCGEEKEFQYGRCDKCGFQPAPVNQKPTQPDDGGFLWGLLGFCIPIVGLILFLIWRDERPVTAKAAGMGALISVIVEVVFFIIYFVFIAAVIGTAGAY